MSKALCVLAENRARSLIPAFGRTRIEPAGSMQVVQNTFNQDKSVDKSMNKPVWGGELPVDAKLLLACHDQHRSLASERASFSDFAKALQISDEIEKARVARGERPVGYKIGFTNRSIWPKYGVHQPIWGTIYDTTVVQLANESCEIMAREFVEPRIEPEIVLGLGRQPKGTSIADLLEAIEWFAHGFEIVQSVYPDWTFTGAEALAAQGLHGALKIGKRLALRNLADPVSQLAALSLTLSLDGQQRAQGCGSNVLDGPIQALAHFAGELARTGKQLQAGDIITTGTLTDAWPLVAGQRWNSSFSAETNTEPALSGIELHVV